MTFAPDMPDEMRQLLYTPETSGGLLLAAAPDRADALAAACAAADQPLWIVGNVLPGEGIEVARTRWLPDPMTAMLRSRGDT